MKDDRPHIIIENININTEDNPEVVREAVIQAINDIKPYDSSKYDIEVDRYAFNDYECEIVEKEPNFFARIIAKLRKYWNMMGEADD